MMGCVLAIGKLRLRCTVNGKALRPLFLKTYKGVLTTTALQNDAVATRSWLENLVHAPTCSPEF